MILIFASILIAVLVFQLFMPSFGQNHQIRFESTGHGVSYSFDASPSFHSNNSSHFHFATRDGVRYYSSSGDLRWNNTFSLNRPAMVARGEYVAVGEESGGRSVYVFDTNGPLMRLYFDYPVQGFSVNETGFLSVILQYGNGHGIRVFHPGYQNGNSPLFSLSFRNEGLLFPVMAEVCQNGVYLALAIVDANVRFSTTVQFRYIGSRGADIGAGVDRGLFASETFQQDLVTSMRFMGGNRLIVATTEQIVCYQLTPRAYAISTKQEIWNMQLNNMLSHIAFYNNSHFAYITGPRHLGAENSLPVGTVRIINAVNGQATGEFHIGRRATHLYMGHDSVIVGSDRNFHAVAFDGTHLWEHNSLFYTREMQFLGSTGTVIIAGANRAEVHERRRVRVVEEFDEFE